MHSPKVDRFRRELGESPFNPDYSWMGVWRMSGIDHRRTLTRKYSYRRFLSRSVVRIHLWVNIGFLPILGLEWRYMPRCVGNLNNQG